MSGAGAILCSCCGKVCTCPRSSAPFVEGCGGRAPVLKLAWEMTGFPVAYGGQWTVDWLRPDGPSTISDNTGVLSERHQNWSTEFGVALHNMTGAIDAGPLQVLPSPSGAAVAGCQQGVAGLYARGTAADFGNGPVEFDALTTTGMPYALGAYASSGTDDVTTYTDVEGTTTATTGDPYSVEGSFLAYTTMTWARDGDVAIRLRTQMINPTAPLDVVTPEPLWSHAMFGATYGEGSHHRGFPQIQPAETSVGAAGPAEYCTLPAVGDVPAPVDEPFADSESASTFKPKEDGPQYGYEITSTSETDAAFRHDPTAYTFPNTRLVLARAESLSVEAVDALPANPGCRDCDRAYHVTITNPHDPSDPKQVDGVFVQRCLDPEDGAALPARQRPYPFSCQWYLEVDGSPSHYLTKVGPQLWRLDPAGVTSDPTAMIWLKGAGDCPSSITESMFFPYVETVDGVGQTWAGRYDIDIAPAEQPETHDCFCDAGCGDCTDEPFTLAADPCPGTVPAVAMARTSGAACDYEGYDGEPEEEITDCGATVLALGNNDYITATVVSYTPAPPPEGYNESEEGPWTWEPHPSYTPGTVLTMTYGAAPAGYNYSFSGVRCDGIGRPEGYLNVDFNFGVIYQQYMPWYEVPGTHTIAGSDGSTLTVTISSPTFAAYRATLKVMRDDAGVRWMELKYGPGTPDAFTGWMIIARKPCAGGPRGTYTVTETVLTPPCTPETIEV